MNLAIFYACVAGYQDHLFDLQLLSVHSGYWSGYYNSAKSKPLGRILDSLLRNHDEYCHKRKNGKKDKSKPDVDVEAFLAQDRYFKEQLRKQGK